MAEKLLRKKLIARGDKDKPADKKKDKSTEVKKDADK